MNQQHQEAIKKVHDILRKAYQAIELAQDAEKSLIHQIAADHDLKVGDKVIHHGKSYTVSGFRLHCLDRAGQKLGWALVVNGIPNTMNGGPMANRLPVELAPVDVIQKGVLA